MMNLIFLTFTAFASSAQTVKTMDSKDFKYVHSLSGVTWEVSIDDKSKYSASGIPEKRQSQVVIERKQSKTAPTIQKITIPNFPNEDGVIFVSLQGVSEPLFLVISKGGELSDEQRRVHLVAASCNKVLGYFDAKMEDPSDLSVQASANDFRVSFDNLEDKKTEITWTRPEDNKPLCSHGFR